MLDLDQTALHELMRRWNVVHIDYNQQQASIYTKFEPSKWRFTFDGPVCVDEIKQELQRLCGFKIIVAEVAQIDHRTTVVEYVTSYQRLHQCPACGEMVEDVDQHAKGIEDLEHTVLLINAA